MTMNNMFDFDPANYSSVFAREGFVYIKHGLSDEFYNLLSEQIEEHIQSSQLPDFALGNKQQALYQFPEGQNYYRQLCEAVGEVCGLDPDKLVLSERHIKTYEGDADPNPLPHKDRFASQVSVGFSVRVPNKSTLVLYPKDQVGVNPFNSSKELRDSLTAEEVPERTLPSSGRVEIEDAPKDVIMFRGNAFWHLRQNPAGTRMLYLKLNDFNCDPLGEDPLTEMCSQQTRRLLVLPDAELVRTTPHLGRRVDYVQVRYNHNWQEVAMVIFWGGGQLVIDQEELRALRTIDGQRNLQAVVAESGGGAILGKLRRLASHGVIDLFSDSAHKTAAQK